MLPPVLVLMVAAFAHFSQERAMEAAVSSYVQDLAESMAYRLNNTSPWNVPRNAFWPPEIRYRIFAWGPSMPGWVAYVGGDGKIILSSPGAVNIGAMWRQDLPLSSAVRVKDEKNREYTMAVYPVDRSITPLISRQESPIASMPVLKAVLNMFFMFPNER